ncbi:MAG: (d)CMP kinase [bacterium]
MRKNIVVAIDGPAGSGKSTTARLVAQKLGLSYIDSGAIYRTFALQFLKKGIQINDEAAIEQLLEHTRIDIEKSTNGCDLILNGKDVSKDIRSLEVTAKVSEVSEHPKVRQVVTRKLRQIAENKSIVVEGRDIGTVVFPDADLKIYLEASIQERAKRRHSELKACGIDTAQEKIQFEIAKRDKHDSERKFSPLSKAHDAILLNNTNLSIEQAVNFIVKKANKLLY